MNARARGFSLVELLVVSVMLTVIMGAVYKTLISQQQSSRHLSAVVSTQQTNRTTAQFLTGEMRELGTSVAGDILTAQTDSIRFRALRKAAFVLSVSGATLSVFSLGDTLVAGDSLVIYADRNTIDLSDDQVVRTTVSAVSSKACAVGSGTGNPEWAQMHSCMYTVTLPGAQPNVFPGAAIRTYEMVTYGHYPKGSETVFGRRLGGDSAVTLIGPLASGSNGFSLQYFDATGTALTAPVTGASLASIARVRITIRGESKGAATPTGTYSRPLVADISLRGN